MVFSKECPDYVKFVFNSIHNGNMAFESMLDVGSNIHVEIIVDCLNMIDNQGIQSISLSSRVYKKDNKVLPIYKLSTGERIFLIATISYITKVQVCFGNVIEQLSTSVLDTFLNTFRMCDTIVVQDPIGYYKSRYNRHA